MILAGDSRDADEVAFAGEFSEALLVVVGSGLPVAAEKKLEKSVGMVFGLGGWGLAAIFSGHALVAQGFCGERFRMGNRAKRLHLSDSGHFSFFRQTIKIL